MLERIRDVRGRYADGVPLTGEDARFLYALLTHHPRSTQKIGCGVRAIVLHEYIGRTRCFFVIRTDGTAEDFSAGRCVTQDWQPLSAGTRALMAVFPYRRVLATWRTAFDLVRRELVRAGAR